MKNAPSARQLTHEFYNELHTCPYCNGLCIQNRCPRCGYKVTYNRTETPPVADMTDIFSKVRYEFFGITVRQVLEILSNGDCATDRWKETPWPSQRQRNIFSLIRLEHGWIKSIPTCFSDFGSGRADQELLFFIHAMERMFIVLRQATAYYLWCVIKT